MIPKNKGEERNNSYIFHEFQKLVRNENEDIEPDMGMRLEPDVGNEARTRHGNEPRIRLIYSTTQIPTCRNNGS